MTKPAPQNDIHLTLANILGEETELLHGPFPEDHPLKILERAAPAEGSDKRYLDELNRHIHACHPKRAGLCLSGGGIRSATFSLGVLQSLSRLQLLDKFDYLSTVSGGGYIGSWLTAWIHRHPRGLTGVIEDLNRTSKAGSEDASLPVRWLRNWPASARNRKCAQETKASCRFLCRSRRCRSGLVPPRLEQAPCSRLCLRLKSPHCCPCHLLQVCLPCCLAHRVRRCQRRQFPLCLPRRSLRHNSCADIAALHY